LLGKRFLHKYNYSLESWLLARHQWLMSIIFATQKAEIRRTVVGSQPRQIVCETLSKTSNIKQGWQSDSSGRVSALASVRPGVQNPVLTKKKKKERKLTCICNIQVMPIILAMQEDHGLKPARANSSQDPISENLSQK
jgi:hypothetical protein